MAATSSSQRKARKKRAAAPKPPASAVASSKKEAGTEVKTDPLVGKQAPRFELEAQGGQLVRSTSLKGKPYVLFFYPKDGTPGCTKEAQAFESLRSEFESCGLAVLGCSPDSANSHERFAEKHKLGFSLLSDPERLLCAAYGVWAEKRNYGRTYMGVVRSTFLIDARGKVTHAWRAVRVKGHAEAVLQVGQSLEHR